VFLRIVEIRKGGFEAFRRHRESRCTRLQRVPRNIRAAVPALPPMCRWCGIPIRVKRRDEIFVYTGLELELGEGGRM